MGDKLNEDYMFNLRIRVGILTLNRLNEVLIQYFVQMIELISFEIEIYQDLIYKFDQISNNFHKNYLVKYHIRLII
jgi:hypothetical protein